MNNFVAVLRDSYREAVSTWVVPVMLAFVLLLVTLVASVGFRPISFEERFAEGLGSFSGPNFMVKLTPDSRGSRFELRDLKASEPAAPWRSDYEFDLTFAGSPELVERLQPNVMVPLTRRRMENYLTNTGAPFLTNLVVTDRSPPPPNVAGANREFVFHVSSKGTKIPDQNSWFHQPSVLFAFDYWSTYTLREGIYKLEKWLVNDVGSWLTLLVSVVITAGFIPNLLRKGAVDLYISKPIGRGALLVYKYLGGLIFVLLLTTALVGGIWLAVGVRSGFWSPNLLLLIPLVTFYFAILYAVSTLAAVLTRSTLVAILATMFAWVGFFGVGFARDFVSQVNEANQKLDEKIQEATAGGEAEFRPEDRPGFRVPKWVDWLSYLLYKPCPRTYDLDDRTIRVIATGLLTDYELEQNRLNRPLPPWAETLGVSLAFIGVCLGLSCGRLATRDG